MSANVLFCVYPLKPTACATVQRALFDEGVFWSGGDREIWFPPTVTHGEYYLLVEQEENKRTISWLEIKEPYEAERYFVVLDKDTIIEVENFDAYKQYSNA